MGWQSGIVRQNQRHSERLCTLKIAAPLPGFTAGQFVRIGLPVDGKVLARPYSLVNAPSQAELEIYFNIVPEGPLSPKLFELQPGSEVMVGAPTGFLVVDEVPDVPCLWMMATGTGIGPFLSILQTDAPWQRFEHVVLCFSVRTQEELTYQRLIADLCSAHPDQFHFLAYVTREPMPNALSERIPQTIANGVLEDRVGVPITPENSHVMMCGNSNMIADVSAQLELRNMVRHRRREPGHYTMEKYH